MNQPWNVRLRAGGALLVVLTLPLLVVGAVLELRTNTNNVLDWLPPDFDEIARLFWFAKRFGTDEILVVSWPGCTLEDPRLPQLAERLTAPAATPTSPHPVPLFRNVFTGPSTLAELTSPPLELPHDEALRRLRGWLLGPDGRTTCAVAVVSRAGMADRHGAVHLVRSAAAACGVAPDDLHLGGPTFDSVAVDEASQSQMRVQSIATIVGTLLFSWLCLRRWRLLLPLFITAMYAWGLGLSLLYVCGVNMDAILLLMPVLVFVLAISGAVHLTRYYRHALAEADPHTAVRLALKRGWPPSVMAAATTVIGVGSLVVSEIVPIRRFGLFAGIGVVGVTISLLCVWPAMMRLFLSAAPVGDEATSQAAKRTSGNHHRAWWRPLTWLSVQRAPAVLFATVAVCVVAAVGATRLHASVSLENLFADQSRIIHNYRWLQDRIGPLVPVEVVLRFPQRDPEDTDELMRRTLIVDRVRREIEAMDHVGGTLAASTFAPDFPRGRGVRQISQRTVAAKRLQSHLPRLMDIGYVRVDGDEELWRISARVESFRGLDYGEVLNDIHGRVTRLLHSGRGDPPAHAEFCGAIPLIGMAQQRLLHDLTGSLLLAFALIAVMMMIMLRSFFAGMLAMLPNAFPALATFGTMGWLGSALNVGAMMTAGAAIGIAVDDTVHWLTWYRREAADGKSPSEATTAALDHCATPMLQTTLICGLGLLPFAFSPFMPIARFAWLLAAMLGAALLGDLVVMPAIINSRTGIFFRPRRATEGEISPAVALEGATPSGTHPPVPAVDDRG